MDWNTLAAAEASPTIIATARATVGNNKQQQYSHHFASVHLIYHYELFVICLLVCLLFATVGPFFNPSNPQTDNPSNHHGLAIDINMYTDIVSLLPPLQHLISVLYHEHICEIKSKLECITILQCLLSLTAYVRLRSHHHAETSAMS